MDGMVTRKLEEYLEENPSTGRAIIDKAKQASIAREAAKKARDSTRRKNALEGIRLPGKLADCQEKRVDVTEIYLVEGDSAEVLPRADATVNIRRSFLCAERSSM